MTGAANRPAFGAGNLERMKNVTAVVARARMTLNQRWQDATFG